MSKLFLYIVILGLLATQLFLVKRILSYRSEKKALQDMLISLLAKYSNRDSILSNYTYITKLGVYRHKFNRLYYCHKCFIDSTKETPLEPKEDGLHCPVCGSFYKDPDSVSSA